MNKEILCAWVDNGFYAEVFEELDKLLIADKVLYADLKKRFIADETTYKFAGQLKVYISLVDLPAKSVTVPTETAISAGFSVLLNIPKQENPSDLLYILADVQNKINLFAQQYDNPKQAQELFSQILTFNTPDKLIFDEGQKTIIQTVLQSPTVRSEHKCVFVSALTINLLKFYDEKIIDLLLFAVFEADEKVWQRALLGLFLGTQKWYALLGDDMKVNNKLATKIKNLQSEPRVQQAIEKLFLAFFLVLQMYDEDNQGYIDMLKQLYYAYYKGELPVEELTKKMTDLLEQNEKQLPIILSTIFNELAKYRNNEAETAKIFAENPFYWFLPFYDQPQFRNIPKIQGKNISYQHLFSSIANLPSMLPDSFKYQVLLNNLQLESWLIDKNIEALQYVQSIFQNDKDFDSELSNYFGLLVDIWAFQGHFKAEAWQKMISLNQTLQENAWLKLIAAEDTYHKLLLQQAYEKEEWETAIESINEYLKINPNNANILFKLGYAYSEIENHYQAIESYQKALKIDNKDYIAWNNLGVAYKNMQEYTKAIECYQQAFSVKSDYFFAQKNLGDLYQYCTKEYNKAIECYQKALEIKPDYQGVLHNLGWVHFIQGQFLEAAKYFIPTLPQRNSFMNLAHIRLWQKKRHYMVLYRKSLALFENKEDFFEGMQEDFQYLQPYGVSEAQFQAILAALRTSS
jgi:tetratricopeptide (TPR) repeat protein